MNNRNGQISPHLPRFPDCRSNGDDGQEDYTQGELIVYLHHPDDDNENLIDIEWTPYLEQKRKVYNLAFARNIFVILVYSYLKKKIVSSEQGYLTDCNNFGQHQSWQHRMLNSLGHNEKKS